MKTATGEHCAAQRPPCRGRAAYPLQSRPPRVVSKIGSRRRWPPQGHGGRCYPGIDKRRENIHPAQAICEDMVQHDHNCDSPIVEPRDENHRPERMLSCEWNHDHRKGGIQQRLLVSWRLTRHCTNVMINPEVKIINPYRAPKAERYLDQPLPQPRNGDNAIFDELPELMQAAVGRSLQDQDDRKLLGNLAGIHGQKRPVGGAGALDNLPLLTRDFGSPTVRRGRFHISIRLSDPNAQKSRKSLRGRSKAATRREGSSCHYLEHQALPRIRVTRLASHMSTWLITGCSTGLGRALAEAVIAAGHNVVTARDAGRVADLAEGNTNRVLALSLDVTDTAQITDAVRQAEEKFGGIDVLVNNAGYGYRAAVEEGDDSDIRKLFETQFFGAVAMIKAVLPEMRARRSGAIVNVSTIGVQIMPVGSGYYAASKAALEGMSGALYGELKPLGTTRPRSRVML
jgi:NADP-dependent 3-hydroxy acid dehydrogenase YdfG